ncbi:MAG: PEP-CTERM sorting domain-containing protein, partial [Planctomycetota bacterium]
VLNLDEDLLGLDDFRLSNRETTVMGVASFENRIETLNVDAFISTTSLNLGDVVDDQTVFTRDPQVITNLSGDSYWGLRLDTETGSQYGFIRTISPDNGVQSEFVIDFAKFNTNVGESILIAAVPEPSTAFLATIALFSCSFRRRRKRL